MGLKPTFEIMANDQDISAALQQRLISLRVTDQSGWESDTLDITLADSDPLKPLALPKTGAELTVKLGYVGELHNLGTYIVDALELSGPPNQLSIKAKAAPQEQTPEGKTSLSTQKTRSWEAGTTLQNMVSKIASEHGLEPAVGESLKAKPLPHVDQVNESDINLMTRICKDLNALVKRGESKSTRGQPLNSINLTATEITDWRLSIQKREVPKSVIATYRNIKQAKDVEVIVGTGEPVKRLKHSYADATSATEAAQAELDKGQRSEQSVSISLPGRPDIRAERRINIEGLRAGVNGEWLVTQVEHSLDQGGLKTSLVGNPVVK